MLAKCIKTQRNVAIKLIPNFNQSEYHCVKIVREIQIMRQLRDNSNGYMFIPTLIDLILPSEDQIKQCFPLGGPEAS